MPGISFDRAATFYDATRGYAPGSAERIRDGIVQHTGANDATRFLELGVGTGRIALPFIEAGYDYTGVDLSPSMLEQLRAKLGDDDSHYRYDLQEADITQLPFEDATFDVIIAVHVLHLVSDWQQVIREARRVLRPGGTLLIAHDKTPDASQSSGAAVCTPSDVRAQWDDIIRALGGRPGQGRRAIGWNNDRGNAELTKFLSSLGASIETVQIAAFQRPPLSARAMAARLRQRMYSSDWQTPDDIHAEAVRQLEQWLVAQGPAADTPISSDGTFEALAARWDAGEPGN